MTIHINYTNYSKVTLPRLYCIHCKRDTDFVAAFQEWYGWNCTCLMCGERRTDNEWMERPFEPRWRKKNIAAAKVLWRRWHG